MPVKARKSKKQETASLVNLPASRGDLMQEASSTRLSLTITEKLMGLDSSGRGEPRRKQSQRKHEARQDWALQPKPGSVWLKRDGSPWRLLNQREGEYSYFLLTEIIFKQLLLLTLRLYFKIIIFKSLILKTGLFHNSFFTLL